MKVLHVIPALFGPFGGPVEAVIQLCEELRNEGIEAEIATTIVEPHGVRIVPEAVPTHYFTRQFDSILPTQFAFSPGLKMWLERHAPDYDLLHIHYLFTFPSTIACYYADKYKIPYILRPAGMLSGFCLKQSAYKKKIYMALFEKMNLRKASTIHFASYEEMDNARCPKSNNKYILVPHGLNLNNFQHLESFKGMFRKNYPQTNGKKIILFLSRINPIKGLDLLIPALRMLAAKRNDFIFVLAGLGSQNYLRRINKTLKNSGLSGTTVLTGFIEGKMKYALLADADVFVLTSYHENFGVAVAEAMACGLAVLISDKVNIHKLIEDNQAGLVSSLNSRDIALKLERLLADDGLRSQMGVNGRKLMQDNFDIKKTTQKMIEIYSDLIHNTGLKKEIRGYWEKEACGTRYGISEDRVKWFKEIEESRYRLDPHIHGFANFPQYAGKRVLEIGVGAGTDFLNFIKNQADAVAMSLNFSSLKLTAEHLKLEGINVNGLKLCLADAEALPFKDNTFELVYAWGVLHHIPGIKSALKEIQRVLRPQGTIKMMLYHIPSWTGWLLWLRFSVLRLKPWESPRKAIFRHLESPGTVAYSLSQVRTMLEGMQFREIKLNSVLGPGDLLYIRPSRKYRAFIYRLLWWIYPRWLVRLLGNRFGLELLIEAKRY